MEHPSFPLDALQSAWLADGYIFAFFSVKPETSVTVTIGQSEAELAPISSEFLERFTFCNRVNLQVDNLVGEVVSVPEETKPGEYYAFWVNELSDWSLQGRPTLQLMLTNKNLSSIVKIKRPLVVDSWREGMVFSALLGAHRANARLHVTFVAAQDDVSETHEVDFDLRYRGGQHASGYKELSLPIPRFEGPIEVYLTVAYHDFVDDGSTGELPFLFIADPHVEVHHLGNRNLLMPLVLTGLAEDRSGTCLCCKLPSLVEPEASINFVSEGKSTSFDIPGALDLMVDDEIGATLSIHSAVAAELCLYVDGQPSGDIMIAPGRSVVRLNSDHLDGVTHLLSLRDRSGTLRYWEDYRLLPSVLTPADVILRETVAPFPSSIFPQTARRFSGLRALLETMDRESDFAQITHAMRTVEGGYDNVDLENLHFPVEDSPEVSIIIPAHNNVKVTYLALCSLLIAPSKARFEVIVVDDASSDETAHLEEIVSGITVIHNETSQRFIRACNAGAKVARGEYIVLLNNDVEVTMGWLDELMAAFDRFENVGLAGAKLVYPNGRLQDGGGIIWNSGNPSNYGKGENPEDPRFCYARQADYLCGAAMMVPKTVWDELGGLSAYLEPMYFEDTDFAFKVREAGFKTWFVPSSVVYHYEGMTSGNDVTKGAKRFQEINRPKFKERWADAFSSFGPEGEEPDLEKDRGIQGRVLFVDYTTPRPDRDAGSYAALQEIRLVQALGYKVSFLPTNLGHLGKYTEDLQKIGVEMIYAPFFLSVQEYLAEHAADFDAIYVTRYYVAKEVLPTVRSYAPNAKVLFNNADLHFLRELRSARVEDDEEKLAAALRTRDQEMEIIGKVDVVLSYSSSEHAVIEAFSDGAARIVRTPWVVEVPAKTAPLAGRHGLSFLGSFNHHPNEEGIVWFTNQVMPMVAAKIPDVGLSIYGSNMKDSLRDLASEHVNPVGYVDDLAQAFDPHRIFIAPLLSGAGIKGKVIEALARGVPCVLSPLAAEGIGLRNGLDCFIARTPDEWLEAIQKLNSDDRVWHEMSNRARDYMAEAFSFERGKAAMHEAFEAAGILPQEISVAQARKVEFRH